MENQSTLARIINLSVWTHKNTIYYSWTSNLWGTLGIKYIVKAIQFAIIDKIYLKKIQLKLVAMKLIYYLFIYLIQFLAHASPNAQSRLE